MKATWHGLFCALVLAFWARPAETALITFFGEDLNPVPDTRLASHPNSDAARENFLAAVDALAGAAGTDEIAGSVTLNFGAAGLGSAQFFAPRFLAMGTDAGAYPLSGNRYLEAIGAQRSGRVVTHNLVVAFGFYGTDIGDQSGQLTVGIGNSTFGMPPFTFDVPHTIDSPSGSVLFFGIVSDDPSETFRVIDLLNTGSLSDVFNYDDLTAAVFAPSTAVPIPSTLALLVPALFAGGALRSRRRLP